MSECVCVSISVPHSKFLSFASFLFASRRLRRRRNRHDLIPPRLLVHILRYGRLFCGKSILFRRRLRSSNKKWRASTLSCDGVDRKVERFWDKHGNGFETPARSTFGRWNLRLGEGRTPQRIPNVRGVRHGKVVSCLSHHVQIIGFLRVWVCSSCRVYLCLCSFASSTGPYLVRPVDLYLVYCA